MDLQELIARGRFVFSTAPERLKVFENVNGKRTARDVAKTLKRHINNVIRDLSTLRDAGLIEAKIDIESHRPIKKNGFPIYDKIALAKTVPIRYFRQPVSIKEVRPELALASKTRRGPAKKGRPLPQLVETEILDICNKGENQIVEFKAAGTDIRKIVKEIAAMANTIKGGYILYGVNDDGIIEGSDQTQQKFDQPLQNCLRSGIAPSLTVKLSSIEVIGTRILVVIVPPWNKRDVYQFDDKVLIRKGTNVFAARPEESKKLHARIPIL